MRRLFLLLIAAAPLWASPQEHPRTPVGIVSPPPAERGELPAQTVRIPGLRAVMLSGTVDKVDGPQTISYRNYLKRVADVLRARGVQVTELYSPTSAQQIEEAVRGAHFIFYAGHGIGSANPPSYTGNITPAGMLVVEKVWLNATHAAAWKPAKGAIVFYLGACFTAGNAGDDIGKINDAEAKKRITKYSAPFFTRNEFGGYYAAWSDSTAQHVMARLFAGQTLGQAYDPEGRMQGVIKSAHPDSPANQLWYHKGTRGGGYVFDYSFVGKPDMTLTQLFGGTQTDPADTTDADDVQNDSDQPDSPANVTPEEARRNGLLLIRALYASNDQEAVRLIRAGADTSVRHGDWTPLMFAAYFNRTAVVSELIRVRADLNARTNGWTALQIADAYGKKESADLLRAAGAKSERSMPGTAPPIPR